MVEKNILFFSAALDYHFLPLKDKMDAANGYLKYWIAVKGYST